MDQEYDRKFEEMKKYIPFLESMIKRLENTSNSSNPRQAQLDKIRSLRDLLLDKKKRMKMENLLKCEQVLVNLYTKVEQKDALPGLKCASDSMFQSKTKDLTDDLETVRNKLKNVAKIQQEQDTLPEIARASATEELCTPGSKEPALFQRRPNKASLPLGQNTANNSNTASTSKRNYTRVLVSPDTSTKRWSSGEENSGSPLFSRRSPRRSPKKYSPTYNKKERKKSKQKPKTARDLNITLNVPEDSLDSLNTKDILTRIMNCSDNDVDIETLREAKRQILNELKHTGAKCDDISDLLLKSYKKKNLKKKDEVEEGELSDSESEAIQSIYGNFILDSDKNATTVQNDTNASEVPRKIQICLVLNSENDAQTGDINNGNCKKPHDTALTDFEMYDETLASTKPVVNKHFENEDSKKTEQIPTKPQEKSDTNIDTGIKTPNEVEVSAPSENNQPANFYKPLADQIHKATDNYAENKNQVYDQGDVTVPSKVLDSNERRSSIPASINEKSEITNTISSELEDKESVEIPLLNDPSIATQKPPKEDVVSEIDILQALKKEILSESLSIPGSETTPLLHQPKITKVSSAQGIVPKKRISIEKYKEKTVDSAKPPLFLHDLSNSMKDDNAKKQSLKLTEKECERFNFSSKLAFEDDESEEDDFGNDISFDDVYGNLVPKSPDNNESQRTKIAPIIIPVEPVTTKVTHSKTDVDMRMFTPLISPNINTSSNLYDDAIQTKLDTTSVDKSRTPIDPRVRKDFNQSVSSESSKLINSERIPRLVPPAISFPLLSPGTPSMSPITPSVTPGIIPGMTPNRTPNITSNMNPCMTPSMTPSRNPSMTPSRNPSMTPSRNPSMTPNARTYEVISQQNFDTGDTDTIRKHVYAPMFSLYDQRESKEQSVSREQELRSYCDRPDVDTRRKNSRWETMDLPERNQRYNNIQKDGHTRHDRRDSFNRSDCTQIPYARTDCPNTPSHPFGRTDASSTPSNPFSWSDCPSTPVPQFGRLECPQTPNPSFGRSDCPLTPSHPFGRVDCPSTPIHPFGRSDMPMTPSHPFGRSEHQSRDPRLNRSSDYDNVQNDDRGRQHHRDRTVSNYNRYNNCNNQNQQREHNFGKHDKNNYSSHEHSNRYHNREHNTRSEMNNRNSMPRDFDKDRHFKDRQRDNVGNDGFNTYEANHGQRKNFYRERSVGRSVETVDRMQHPSSSQTNQDNDNRLSVKPHTGKSFTIDTSIKSTFQSSLVGDNNIKSFDSKFDRRKRAASVGRVLCTEPNVGRISRRESSVGKSFQRESSWARSLEFESKYKNCMESKHKAYMDHSKQKLFRRARSVGRDMYNDSNEKSFKDIKIDFQNFKAKCDSKKLKGLETLKSEVKHDIQSNVKESSHRFNHRYKKDNRVNVKTNADSRNRRDFDCHKNRSKEVLGRNQNKKTQGIVYSNDNITKGKILGSGYGVKNYKIPKIKRSTEEEKPTQSEKEETKHERSENKRVDEKINVCNIKDNNIKSQQKSIKSDNIKCDRNVTNTEQPRKIDKKEKPDKRVTRLSKNFNTGSSESINDNENTTLRPRRIKKSLANNSDSDTEENRKTAKKNVVGETNTTVKKNENIVTKPKENTVTNQQKKSRELTESLPKIQEKTKSSKTEDNEEDTLASINSVQNTINIDDSSDMNNQFDSFAMDDMEIFSDNIPSDSVIDNINALIANLDSDLEPTKNKTSTKFTNDISLENMLENINSDEENDVNVLSVKFKDISDVIEKDLDQSTTITKGDINNFDNTLEKMDKNDKIESPSKDTTQNSEMEGDNDIKNDSKGNSCNSDNLVTTTAIDNTTITDVQVHNILDNTAAPDSTNEILDKKSGKEDGLPDSTNDTQNDTSSMVTSSHDSSETDLKNNEPRLSINNDGSSIDSIGSILSILQNKSKLKEILSMLGDQSSDNDKIKKKLEKLSEIVSDEDDDGDKNESDVVKDQQGNLSVNVEECKDTNETVVDPQNGSNAIIREGVVDPQNGSNAIIREGVTENSVDESQVMLPENQTSEIDNSNAMKQTKKTIKKGKVTKKGKGKANRKIPPKGLTRITRSGAKESKPKKPSRELLQLQEDIREMFISHDVLNTTGIRMCRLAKLVDEVNGKQKDTDSGSYDAPEPIVVLKKFKDNDVTEEIRTPEKIIRKKPITKRKSKIEDLDDAINITSKKSTQHKPGPKSKTKPVNKSDDEDPYAFESDSFSESNYNTNSLGDKVGDSSESDNESVVSSKSCESSQLLVEIKKKPKRKKFAWQAGIIKSKNKKKKSDNKRPEVRVNDDIAMPQNIIPDSKCFTDKSYCFQMNVTTYACRFCPYSGEDIVNHYKQNHPHTEIPLSRPSPDMAKQAIEQCEEINVQAISKMPSDMYVCRFCFKKFGKKKASLEAFFWHVVSMHTGEYKHQCTLCPSYVKCPFNLDIPPPPKDAKGQVIGYICEKCNFTQISLENLKTHVIVRHNDEKTEVYIINLSILSLKAITTLAKRCSGDTETPRVLRSRQLSHSMTEASDDLSDVTDSDISNEQLSPRKRRSDAITSAALHEQPQIKYQSKISFETDDNTSETSSIADSLNIKKEKEENQLVLGNANVNEVVVTNTPNKDSLSETVKSAENNIPGDIFSLPHFKIKYNESGSKEYVCCINGQDNHYKTTLLISFKKHVQLKHSETWDGYCFICKVIVTSQGKHKFQDCLHHYIDKHIDTIPVIENSPDGNEVDKEQKLEEPSPPPSVHKPYINVRPLSELMCTEAIAEIEVPTLPKIENVISLGAPMVELPPPSPLKVPEPVPQVKENKHEEVQAEVMSKKHRVVLTAMMNQIKLVHLFKCAGRFCSFTSNNPEESLVHASTHQSIGGENSLSCCYCDYDCAGNGIDLVMHVFKDHITSPYVCGYCFYRAASSQLVSAHISRIHNGKPTLVLSAINTTPPPLKTSSMLPREAVVQYYVCPHACKFRTYTAGKYCEHLLQRHSTETGHPCYICSVTSDTPVQLIQHLKCHELNVYQCTWCVHGASTEGSLLYHTSQKHPDQQPQAYLRVITNKDGSSEFRVLPLASFNKTKVPVTTVAPDDVVEDAAREAERSLDLEKLIGHTSRLIESTVEAPVAETIAEPIEEPIREPIVEPIFNIDTVAEKDEAPPPAPQPSRTPLVAQPAPAAPANDRPPVVLKSEPDDAASARQPIVEVVCLDSDEDEPPPQAPPPAEAAPPPPAAKPDENKFALVANAQLLRCPGCSSLFRTVYTFKRHALRCLSAGPLACAHCSLPAADVDALVGHYVRDHGAGLPFACYDCAMRFESALVAKRHLKYTHRVLAAVVDAEPGDSGARVVRPAPAAPPPPPPAAARRKRSAGAEPPPKLARYGPQDAHLLPINPILDEAVFCAVCEFKTKVRLNMVRHLQLHAERQPAPNTAPVNPVPHLETNEMHFDRMVNLASSSIGSAPRPPPPAGEGGSLGAEAGSRYPRAVAERARLACGARGCSYISLDEDMLRRHWDALHAGSNDFRCVHCPPYQHLDTSRPLTGARVVAHLKMHDAALYACSACSYYHYRRALVDKHAAEAHAAARSLVVREPSSEPAPAPAAAAPAPAPAPAAPTMDLKPWRCGLCAFLSMLRPEVVDHCARMHQSKMQFKCTLCPFRASAEENVTKHQANAHAGRQAEVLYYYYREGSVPDEPDGTPRWRRQRERFGPVEVKSEAAEAGAGAEAGPPAPDLSLVKREAEEPAEGGGGAAYGPLCAPNGLKYKCPLCKEGGEDTEDAMRSHLYEELKYRRWACAICSYKAFHKTGLNEHIMSEHRGQNQQPTMLPPDTNIEKWVNSLLAHQTEAINKNKENLAKQKIINERPSASTTTEKSVAKPPEKPSEKFSMKDLEQAFGQLGVPNNMFYCCPKCNYKIKEESSMRDHLEAELSKIRWCCSNCADKFQTYHEAQFHCKSVHSGLASRPVEASRDLSLRAAWVAAVLQVQRLSMRCLPLTELPEATEKATPAQDLPENSLLVVRHEESVSTSEESLRRKRPAPNDDSEDERLVIDEPCGPPAKRKFGTQCLYCDFSSKYGVKEHVYRHYNLKPYQCPHCSFTGYRAKVVQHIDQVHSEKPYESIKFVALPNGPPPITNLSKVCKTKRALEEDSAKACLVCEATLSAEELERHAHDGVSTVQCASKGDIVVKCCICLALRKDTNSIEEHHKTAHPSQPLNYAYFKFLQDTRNVHCCGHCEKRFYYLKDIKPHHEASHASLTLKYHTIPYSLASLDIDDRDRVSTDSAPPAAKRVARKSTSKLPAQAVARKSTTKLPLAEETGYSFYGTKPAPLEDYENVTTIMSFCNTMVPFTMRKLKDVLVIDPVVLVQDINRK